MNKYFILTVVLLLLMVPTLTSAFFDPRRVSPICEIEARISDGKISISENYDTYFTLDLIVIRLLRQLMPAPSYGLNPSLNDARSCETMFPAGKKIKDNKIRPSSFAQNVGQLRIGETINIALFVYSEFSEVEWDTYRTLVRTQDNKIVELYEGKDYQSVYSGITVSKRVNINFWNKIRSQKRSTIALTGGVTLVALMIALYFFTRKIVRQKDWKKKSFREIFKPTPAKIVITFILGLVPISLAFLGLLSGMAYDALWILLNPAAVSLNVLGLPGLVIHLLILYAVISIITWLLSFRVRNSSHNN